jgi:hypothetical protein
MVVGISKKKKGKGFFTTSSYGNSRPTSSRLVHHSYRTAKSTGHLKTTQQESLNSVGIQRRQGFEHEQQQARMETMSSTELQELDAIRAGEDPLDDNWGPEHQLDINDILSGKATADISNAGEEFRDLLEMEDDWVEIK